MTIRSLLDDCPRVVIGPGAPDRPLARFALIGDVHAEDERLLAAIAVARRERAEHLLCVGDVADGHGDLDRTIAVLERERVLVVRGNHDRWFLTDHLRTLRPVQLRAEHERAAETVRLWLPFIEVSTIRGPLLLCHAIGEDDFSVLKAHTSLDDVHAMAAWEKVKRAGRFRFMAAGHTHDAMVRELDGIVVLNPGTLHRGSMPCVAIVDLQEETMELHDLDDPTRPFLRETLAIP